MPPSTRNISTGIGFNWLTEKNRTPPPIGPRNCVAVTVYRTEFIDQESSLDTASDTDGGGNHGWRASAAASALSFSHEKGRASPLVVAARRRPKGRAVTAPSAARRSRRVVLVIDKRYGRVARLFKAGRNNATGDHTLSA